MKEMILMVVFPTLSTQVPAFLGAHTKRPKTKRPRPKTSQPQKVPPHKVPPIKRPSPKRSQPQNVPSPKTSQPFCGKNRLYFTTVIVHNWWLGPRNYITHTNLSHYWLIMFNKYTFILFFLIIFSIKHNSFK